MKRRLLVGLASVLLLVASTGPVAGQGWDGAAGEKRFTKGGTYIVLLDELPVVAYDGSISGYRKTKPAPGSKIDPDSTDVVKYVGYLTSRHDAVLKSAGVGATKKLYDYGYSFNGFAAKLTAAQANRLAVTEGVVAVTPEQRYEVDTSSTPAFLGLNASGGLWEQLGGPTGTRTVAGAGENIVIGVIDSGVWPESRSFSDRNAEGQLIYANTPPSAYHGKCAGAAQVIDPAWDASRCNKKLIGAQFFNASWGGNDALEAARPWEFMSPRDYNGHGTHTSSTAGGNFGVQTTGDAAVFGSISGMAPRARIATYKALWSNQDASQASGLGGDLVAAIDTAVADGVDVINYSISGTSTNFLDPAEVAFLFAAQAGIFVSQSAGNSGPAVSTVAHPGPWTTTVAAGTHNRNGVTTITLGNGAVYSGASLTNGVGPAPIVDADTVGLPGVDLNLLRQCYSASPTDGTPLLDPAKVAGKIVICERGGATPNNARVDKSLAVQQADGVGVVVANVTVNSLNADLHSIPAIHVNNTDGAAITTYAAGAGAEATIAQATVVLNQAAPFTASFSSRGPLLAGGGDVLKPDVIAPGQDILAAVAPPGSGGKDFNILSGTSMSAPHVAGLAALLIDLRPSWSPMAIKSALMTTGYDVLDGPNTNPLVIFRQGAGHVRPNSAADPGLVYEAGFDDWRGFLRSQGLCTFCFGSAPAPVFDPSDYNSASIAIGALAGTQTVTRRVTNVGTSAATYTPSVTGMSGITTVVSPSSLDLDPGETGTFTVHVTTAGATLNAYTGGQLTWTDGTHNVRIPLVVKPVALAAPAQVSGNGGPISYDVTFGYTGAFTAEARGLIPAVTESRTVLDDPTDSSCSLTSPNAQIHEVAVPAGTTYARFSLFDAFTDGADDLDMCVFNAGGTNVGSSGSGTSAEEVNLINPAAGTYRVVVQGWGTDGPDAQYTLFYWLLGNTGAGNMSVTAPASATLGTTAAIQLTFSGLAPATKYLGSVAYGGIAGLPNPTIVRVDTP